MYSERVDPLDPTTPTWETLGISYVECLSESPQALPWNLMVSLMISSVSATALYSPTFTSLLSGKQRTVARQLGLPRLCLSQALAVFIWISLPLTPTPVGIIKLVAGLGWNLSRVSVCPVLYTQGWAPHFLQKGLCLITPSSCSVRTLSSDFPLLGWLSFRAAWTISSSAPGQDPTPLGQSPAPLNFVLLPLGCTHDLLEFLMSEDPKAP